jgi:hypothetical protein
MKVNQLIKGCLVFVVSFISLYSYGQDEVITYHTYPEKHKRVIVWDIENNREVSYQRSSYDLKFSGSIEISDNDKDITGVSENGYFIVSKIVFGNSRKIEIRSDENGKLTKKYFEGKTEGSFEKEGKQWLADILPDIIRRTGVGAESRVQRIYKSEGIKGLLNEIEEIDEYSGSVRNLYFVVMVDLIDFNEQELAALIPAMEMIRSNSTKGTLMRNILFNYNLSEANTIRLLKTTSTLDYNTERGSTLRVLNNKLKQHTSVMESYFVVLEDMGINSEKGNVLKHLMKNVNLQPQYYVMLFESLTDFSSEREKGAVLLSALKYMPMDDEVIEAFIETVEDMSSHYYILKGEIMNALVDQQASHSISKGNKTVILQMLSTAIDFNSNSQKGLTMRKVNRILIDDYEVLQRYAECLESISDQIEKYNVILDLLETQKLSKKGYEMVLDATNDIVRNDYQHAAGAVLRMVLKDMPEDDELIYNFFGSVNRMDQNSTVEEILRYINTNPRFMKNEQVVIKSIESVERIDVAIEKAAVLEIIKPQIKTSEQKLAYNYAVKEISSEYLKRKVML